MVTLDEAGRGALGARVYTVRGPSGPWVEHATVVDFRELRRTNWKVLPDVAPHLLVHLEHDGEGLRAGRVALVGARTRAIETDVSARAWSVGVRLRPGSLAALSGLPADELTDRAVDAAEVWRGPAASLDGEVAEAAVAGPEAVRAVLLRFVDGRARRAAEVSWVARALRSEPAGRCTAVGDLARALGIAPRTLRARARAEVGLSPKRIARIHRIFRALEASRTAPKWTDVAARCGFTDQPHLVREFRSLLGESPATYAARALP